MITGLFVVICGAMTACGDSAVTEKDAPDVRREKKKNSRFVTDTNMYLNVEGEEEAWTECFQARLDGTNISKRKRLRHDGDCGNCGELALL